MKVNVQIIEKDVNCLSYSEVEDWSVCDTPTAVYKAAIKEYGRCVSKIYMDTNDPKKPCYVGWVFEKRRRYEDADKYYIQETWIAPLTKYETKVVVEYALAKSTKNKQIVKTM